MVNTTNQIRQAEKEAAVLLNYARHLSEAAESNDEVFKLTVLDENLKLWVGIETSLKNAKNLLPEEIKKNLISLSKYVERLTLSKGIRMTKGDYENLININMQISEGLLESVKNSLAKEEAFSLLKCAVDLSNAKENKDAKDLVAALDNNMNLWVYIKTMVNDKNTQMPHETKSNLIKLADYISSKTIEIGKNVHKVNDKALDSLIMTNLQNSEGLLANQKMAVKLTK